MRFYVAPTFYRAVQRPNTIADLAFFSGRLQVLPVGEVRAALAQMDLVPAQVSTDPGRNLEPLRQDLRARAPDDLVADILYEEWLFATGQSVVVARLKRVFQTLADAGARVVEVMNRLGAEGYERLLSRLPEDHLKTLERLSRLKEISSYIGNGASLAIAVLAPMLGTPIDPPNLVDDLLVVLDP
jgi:hypothetical protein